MEVSWQYILILSVFILIVNACFFPATFGELFGAKLIFEFVYVLYSTFKLICKIL